MHALDFVCVGAIRYCIDEVLLPVLYTFAYDTQE
jgi:hypothetical protein